MTRRQGRRVLALAVCASILLYFVFESVRKYFLFETGTADKYMFSSELGFMPEITLCPANPQYNESRLKEHGIDSLWEYQFKAKWVSQV